MARLNVPWFCASMGGPNSWGSNLSAQTRSDQAFAYLVNQMGCASDGYINWSGSMGSAEAILAALYAPQDVIANGCALPIVDLEQVRAGVPTYTAAIEAVHGNPVPNAKRAITRAAEYATPTGLWISETDNVGDPTLAHSFGTTVGAEVHSMGNVAHSYQAQIDIEQVVSFLEPFLRP